MTTLPIRVFIFPVEGGSQGLVIRANATSFRLTRAPPPVFFRYFNGHFG